MADPHLDSGARAEQATQPLGVSSGIETYVNGESPHSPSASARQAPSKVLKDLPQEMILEIVKNFSNLAGGGGQKNLYNLCLIKPFAPAATELLYGDRFMVADNNLLLRTVLEKPKLATLIRCLALHPSCTHATYGIQSDAKPLNPADVSLFCSTIESLDVLDAENEHRWIERIKTENCQGALCALLLLHTPNINTLILGGCCRWQPFDSFSSPVSRYWEAVIHREGSPFLAMPSPSFGNMKEVSIEYAGTLSFASIMKLPMLEILRIDGRTRHIA